MQRTVPSVTHHSSGGNARWVQFGLGGGGVDGGRAAKVISMFATAAVVQLPAAALQLLALEEEEDKGGLTD